MPRVVSRPRVNRRNSRVSVKVGAERARRVSPLSGAATVRRSAETVVASLTVPSEGILEIVGLAVQFSWLYWAVQTQQPHLRNCED